MPDDTPDLTPEDLATLQRRKQQAMASLAPDSPPMAPNGDATQGYMNIVRQPAPVMPRPLASGPPGSFVDSSGATRTPTRLSQILAPIAAGFVGATDGPQAGQKFYQDKVGQPLAQATEQAGTEEAQRTARLKELQPAMVQEENRATRIATADIASKDRAASRDLTEAIAGQRNTSTNTLAYRKLGLNPDGSPIPDEQLSAMEKLKLATEQHRATNIPMPKLMADAWLEANHGKTLNDYQQWQQNIKAQAGGGMSPEALQAWTAAVLTNPGIIGSLGGFGSAGRKRQVVESAGKEANKAGVNLGTQGLEAKAGGATLTQLQEQRATLAAYESTAKKNLGQFESRVKSLTDSGSPWINEPLRDIQSSGTGDPQAAAALTAMTIARTEIERILASANQIGNTPITDKAREEYQNILPQDATLAQYHEIINVLRQDMTNRIDSVDEQIKITQGSLGNPAAAPANQPANSSATPKLAVGQTVTIKGKPMTVTAIHPDGSFDAK